MKKVLFSILAIVVSTTFFACSNGDYNANPTSAANESVNPFSELDSAAFSWSGADAVSANINGNGFNVDSTKVTFTLTGGGANVITAYTGISRGLYFELKDVYAGNIYNLGYANTDRHMAYKDSLMTGPITYFSYYGNVGQVQILRNDPNRIIGRFHYQALNQLNGTVINVSNGWFNVRKF